MRTVVCGVDHSPAAPAVVAIGARLARSAGARLVLAHVRPAATAALTAAMPFDPLPIGPVTELAEDAALLELLRADARHAPAATRLLEGDPAAALCRLARDERADLLVVGSRGLGAVGRALLGSVSAGVVRRAPCPAVVAPPGRAGERRTASGTAVVAGIGAPGDRRVAELAGTLAREVGLKLRLAHVLVPAPGATCENRRHRVARMLYSLLDELATRDPDLVASAEVRILAGDPATGIAQLAEREDAAAVVVGAPGRGPLREVLGPSTASELLRGAPAPVVVCRDGRP